MNLIIQPGNTRSSAALDTLIESRLIALADRQRIEEAVVRLNDHREGSPAHGPQEMTGLSVRARLSQQG